VIAANMLSQANLKATVEEIKARKGSGKWSERVAVTDRFSVTVIHQPPGTPNDHHYHNEDEVWYIYQGELTWQYEHHPEPVRVKTGDLIFGPKGLWHHIEPVGDQDTIRIGISATGEFHRYDREGCKPLPTA
jgi:mannose-6-phosphate isomerase-like protein (cupin superfamily)